MSITFSVSGNKALPKGVELLLWPLHQGQTAGRLMPQLRKLSFGGAWAQAELVAVHDRRYPPFVGVIGLGARADSLARQAEGLRRGLGKLVQEGRRHSLRTIGIDLRGRAQATNVLAEAAVEAVELANYRFTEYVPRLQREQAARAIRRVILLVDKDQQRAARRALTRAQTIVRGVQLARQLVNQPASAVSPRFLVETARSIVDQSPALSVKIFDRAAAQQAGFSAFLAVARGSQEEPYVIHLTYKPKNRSPESRPIFLVGKGVTFDSGGLSLKPAEGMEQMKIDMAGAASVLGLFSVLSALQLPIEVHGIIATCENMPSGSAYRPGDVLRAKNGKTIEVVNTDAEGRIILADALSYAVEQKPAAVIDLATLTGACMVALGETVAGLWTNDASLEKKFMAAAEQSGEQLCAMPLPEEYRAAIESKVADVRNLALSRFGGAITAALFLREFVNDTPWAHLDIAGPCYLEKPILPYYDAGATGYGVRLLAEFLSG